MDAAKIEKHVDKLLASATTKDAILRRNNVFCKIKKFLNKKSSVFIVPAVMLISMSSDAVFAPTRNAQPQYQTVEELIQAISSVPFTKDELIKKINPMVSGDAPDSTDLLPPFKSVKFEMRKFGSFESPNLSIKLLKSENPLSSFTKASTQWKMSPVANPSGSYGVSRQWNLKGKSITCVTNTKSTKFSADMICYGDIVCMLDTPKK